MSLGGVLRGLGKQKIATYLLLLSFIVFGHPVAILLAFYFDWKLAGLLCGLISASIILTILYAFTLLQINWEDTRDEIISKMKMVKRYDNDSTEILNSELKEKLIA